MKKILFLFYLLLCSVLLLEVVIRIWGYSSRYIYDPIYTPYAKSKDIPYVHKQNLSCALARGHALINTDGLGLRAANVGAVYGPKKVDQFRIAVVGDSVTFGEGVPETAETYVAVLEKEMNRMLEGKQVQTFNFGVSAYSVREMAATLYYRVPEVQPDIVIMAIVPEDFTLSRTGAVDKWGYTVHANTTGIIGTNSVLKRILRNVHLTYLVRDIIAHYRVSRGANANNTLAPEAPVTIPVEIYQYVLDFRETAERMQIPSLLVLLPPINHTFDSTFLKQLLRDQVVFLDLHAIQHEFPADLYKASKFDAHLSSVVHRRIAEELAPYLVQWVQ